MVYPYKKIKLRDGRTKDEHRLVMEQILGRCLTKYEAVHHINGNKRDNKPTNLELTNISQHTKDHLNKGHILNFTKEQRREYGAKGGKTKAINSIKKRDVGNGYYICTKCKITKHHSEFSKHKGKWNGLEARCKECEQERHRMNKMQMKH